MENWGKDMNRQIRKTISWPRNTEFQRNIYLLNIHLFKYVFMSKHTNYEISSLIYQFEEILKL